MSKACFAIEWSAAHKVAPAEFAERIFEETLYPHVRRLVAFIKWFAPEYFDIDYEMIARTAAADSVVEVARIANSYAFFQREDGFFRRVLCLRVSGRKLMEQAHETMLPLSVRQQAEGPAQTASIGISMAVRTTMDPLILMKLSMPGATTVTVNSAGRHHRAKGSEHLVLHKNLTATSHGLTFDESWAQIHGGNRDYVEGVFYRALYPHARWFARLVRFFYRNYFAADYAAIRWISAATTVQEVRSELANYRYHHPERGVFRRALRLRVSSKRLVHMAACILPK